MTTRNPTERLEDCLLDTERLLRYYGTVADRMQALHSGLSLLVIVGSIAAGTSILATDTPYNDLAGVVLFLTVAITSATMVVYDFSQKSQKARSAHNQLQLVSVELRRLWYSDHSDPSVPEVLDRSERQVDEASRDDLSVNEGLNYKCNEEAYAMLRSYYPGFSRREGDSGGGSSPTSDTAIPAVETK